MDRETEFIAAYMTPAELPYHNRKPELESPDPAAGIEPTCLSAEQYAAGAVESLQAVKQPWL
jgi:hypothetical protein